MSTDTTNRRNSNICPVVERGGPQALPGRGSFMGFGGTLAR